MSEPISVQGREHWSSRSAFVFAAIGSAIGLGNVWRFPRICAENGGFAFLVAFVVALLTAGIPILILELAMGERTQRATPGAFKKVDRQYEWFGWCIVGVGFLITCYYAVIMSWCWSYAYYAATQAWGDDPKGFFFGEFLGLSDAAALPGAGARYRGRSCLARWPVGPRSWHVSGEVSKRFRRWSTSPSCCPGRCCWCL